MAMASCQARGKGACAVAFGPGCILRSQKQGKVLQSEGLAHEYRDPGSGQAQNQIHLWCVCPEGPLLQCYQHLQGVAFAPQQGGSRPTKNTSSVSTVLKIFKTPIKDLGKKKF